MNRLPSSAAAALLALALPAAAFAQASAVPNLMSYQSRVADAAGVPLGSTAPVNRIVLFRVWDSPGASAPANRLFSEQQTVTIANGEFSVLIGSGTAIATENTNAFATLDAAVFGGATRYLGVTVDDGDGNPFNDPELSPRQQIVGTPFAFRAKVAEAVASGGVNALSLANSSVNTAAIAPGAVTTTQLAPGAVGPGQIADAAVGTGQVVDASITLAKLAPDSVDGSKIVNGSIGLADLSPGLVSNLPKPTVTYDQGLEAFTARNSGHQYLIFPIDLNSIATDGRVVISYEGMKKSGATAGTGFYANGYPASTVNSSPQTISGSVRITVPTFLGGSGSSAITNVGQLPSFGSTGAALAAPATNIPFVAVHTGLGPKSNFSVTGVLGYASASPNNSGFPSLVAGSEPADADTPGGVSTYIIQNFGSGYFDFGTGAYFPRGAASWYYTTWIDPNTFPSAIRMKNYTTTQNGSFFSGAPVAAAVHYARSTTENFANNQAGNFTVNKSGSGFGMFYIFTYYPGSISGITAAANNVGQDVNNGANIPNFSGPPMTLNVASVQASTNRLTITLANPHVIQIGDTVVISGMTGTPAVNASYTVAAVPSNNSFELAAPGVVGPYTGGTITHTPTYNKYRFWVAVHNTYNARVTVSDK